MEEESSNKIEGTPPLLYDKYDLQSFYTHSYGVGQIFAELAKEDLWKLK